MRDGRLGFSFWISRRYELYTEHAGVRVRRRERAAARGLAWLFLQGGDIDRERLERQLRDVGIVLQ